VADISTPEDSPINSTSEDPFEVASTEADAAPADAASAEVGGTESVNSAEAPEAAAASKTDLADAIDAVPSPELSRAAAAPPPVGLVPAGCGRGTRAPAPVSTVNSSAPVR